MYVCTEEGYRVSFLRLLERTRHTLYIPGLNGLQVNQVDRENDKRTSTCTLIPSKLLAACNTRVQLSGCALTIRTTPKQLLHES